jgi:hypothetical protein
MLHLMLDPNNNAFEMFEGEEDRLLLDSGSNKYNEFWNRAITKFNDPEYKVHLNLVAKEKCGSALESIDPNKRAMLPISLTSFKLHYGKFRALYTNFVADFEQSGSNNPDDFDFFLKYNVQVKYAYFLCEETQINSRSLWQVFSNNLPGDIGREGIQTIDPATVPVNQGGFSALLFLHNH